MYSRPLRVGFGIDVTRRSSSATVMQAYGFEPQMDHGGSAWNGEPVTELSSEAGCSRPGKRRFMRFAAS